MTEADANDPEKQSLTEIGPRFVLDPIRPRDTRWGRQRFCVLGPCPLQSFTASVEVLKVRGENMVQKALGEWVTHPWFSC